MGAEGPKISPERRGPPVATTSRGTSGDGTSSLAPGWRVTPRARPGGGRDATTWRNGATRVPVPQNAEAEPCLSPSLQSYVGNVRPRHSTGRGDRRMLRVYPGGRGHRKPPAAAPAAPRGPFGGRRAIDPDRGVGPGTAASGPGPRRPLPPGYDPRRPGRVGTRG